MPNFFYNKQQMLAVMRRRKKRRRKKKKSSNCHYLSSSWTLFLLSHSFDRLSTRNVGAIHERLHSVITVAQ